MTFLIFFVLGLMVGSFINVLVYRLHVAEEIIWDRSKCPKCKKVIAWHDNIPLLSFILLKFRCRNCRKKISWQYPLVELGTALAFGLIGFYSFNATSELSWTRTLYYLGLAGFFMVIFVYDWLYMEIPDIVLWSGIAWALVFNLYLDLNILKIQSVWESGIFSGVLAAVLAFGFFITLAVLSREKWMGAGDAYLAILLGLVLGWPKIWLGIILAFSFGAIFGLIMIALGKKKLKSQVPFAPFLIAGSVVSLIFHQTASLWFMSLIGAGFY